MDKFLIMQRCYEDNSLKMSSKLVMQYLVYKSDKNGRCFPSVARIARELSLSERTIQRHMRILEKAGYLTVNERYMHQGYYTTQLTNSYELSQEMAYPKRRNNEATAKERELVKKHTGNSPVKKAALCKKVFSCADLKSSDKLLLIYLIQKSGKSAVAVNSIQHILNAMNICLKTLLKMLERIVNTGFVTVRQEEDCLIFLIQGEFSERTEETEGTEETVEESQEEFLFSIPVQLFSACSVRTMCKKKYSGLRCRDKSGQTLRILWRLYNPKKGKQTIKGYERYLDDS